MVSLADLFGASCVDPAGDMQLTVIPNSESDIMREWVRDATPPLLAEYASVPVSLWMWREEEMQIMRPPKSDGKG